MYRGRLDKWDSGRGYGLIRSEELTHETHIHISALEHMARQPVAGDFILFELADQQGILQAVNARIEGVKTKFPSELTNDTKPGSINILYYLMALAIAAALFIFIRSEPSFPYLQLDTYFTFDDTLPQKTYICDGRQYCRQMTSREEALFFIRNCPNTKMDGDYDGVPCENDSRF